MCVYHNYIESVLLVFNFWAGYIYVWNELLPVSNIKYISLLSANYTNINLRSLRFICFIVKKWKFKYYVRAVIADSENIIFDNVKYIWCLLSKSTQVNMVVLCFSLSPVLKTAGVHNTF
jgi:hypothetical protein